MAHAPAALILDDGELDDVQEILEGLGVEFGRVRGGAIVANMAPPRALLVATPRRISAVAQIDTPPGAEGSPIRVVVVREDSNRLREQLREIGFDYIVRRPVHPEALRLLIMHGLYCGEERRREPRVAVGLEVSFRTGELPRRATLVDLSTGGCRLLSSYPLEADKKIRVNLPESVGATEDLTIEGRILRTSFDEQLGEDGMYRTAIQFEDLSGEVRNELEWIIEDKVGGPPVAHDCEAAGEQPLETDSGVSRPPRRTGSADRAMQRDDATRRRGGIVEKMSPSASADPRSAGADVRATHGVTDAEQEGSEAKFAMSVDVKMAPVSEDPPEVENDTARSDAGEREPETGAAEQDTGTSEPATEAPHLESGAAQSETEELEPESDAAVATEAPTGSHEERRSTARHPYGAKVPAFGNRALRVLVGRDLGMGGMRIAYHPDLEVGDRLNLAIYGAAGEEPFLVWGTIARSEGSNGMAVVFDPVHSVIAEKLEKLVATLPSVESLHDDEAAAMGTVLTEILNE